MSPKPPRIARNLAVIGFISVATGITATLLTYYAGIDFILSDHLSPVHRLAFSHVAYTSATALTTAGFVAVIVAAALRVSKHRLPN